MDLWTDRIVRLALEEDLGAGDVTSWACVPPAKTGLAVVVAQSAGVVSGLAVANDSMAVASGITGEIAHLFTELTDGDAIEQGTIVLTIQGSLRTALAAERVLLNFLQHLSGIASETRRYVTAIEGTGARIADTRKTTPGLRVLEKSAVRHGGGVNHRFGLYDGVLIKDNHIVAAGGVTAAVRAARAKVHHLLKIQVECENESQAEEAVNAGADALLLDNIPLDLLSKLVRRFRERVLIEASGGVTLANVRQIAETGVHLISVGSITHSAPALPMHLEVRA